MAAARTGSTDARDAAARVSDRAVILYTRQLCGLCDEAEAELRRLAPLLGFTLIERDVDLDADLRDAYNDIVPVIAVGERIVDHAPVDTDGLRAALEAALAD